MFTNLIHYCWLGEKKLPLLSERCLESWDYYCPGYKIVLWDNRSINDIRSKYLEKAIKDKMWAFATDYLRVYALYHYGGIYLDVDMEVIRRLDILQEKEFEGYSLVFCEESEGIISAGFMAAEPNHFFLKKVLDYYESTLNKGVYLNIPKVLTNIYYSSNKLFTEQPKILSHRYFYPYSPYRAGGLPQLMYSDITEDTYGVHHWQKSWEKSFYQRFKSKLFQIKKK